MVREAPTIDYEDLAVDGGQTVFAAAAFAAAAFAAAALVAAVRHNDIPEPGYWPDFLTAGERIDLPDELIPLARRALDLVAGPESELHELWTVHGPNPDWERQVTSLRAALHS
jgi:uncharacterized protein DUF4259